MSTKIEKSRVYDVGITSREREERGREERKRKGE